MSTTSRSPLPRLKYHPDAYQFVNEALRQTQEQFGRSDGHGVDDDDAHITGPELLEGIRKFALKRFGLMTQTVFRQWGVRCTDDFGRIVFELIEHGAMRKTERDQLSDFFDVYEFEEVFDKQYRFNLSHAFTQ